MAAYDRWLNGATYYGSFAGGAFDGAAVWMVPYSAPAVFDVPYAGTVNTPFRGGLFDGRSVWLVPGNAPALVRVDCRTGNATAYTSWPDAVLLPRGNWAFFDGVFDGHSLWLVP